MQAPDEWPVPHALVDPARLAGWMDGQHLGQGAPLENARLLTGGTQNILIAFDRGDRSFVLRRPPEHKRRNSDETMRREARVLAALRGSDVPHPGFIAGCGDVDVLDATFYLMEPVDGFNPAAEPLPAYHAADARVRHRMGLSMADAIAAVGRFDHEAAGLNDMGKPGYLERQVPRWQGQLASYSELDGYPGPDIPSVDDVGAWLLAHQPAHWTPGLLHGDFHFANVLFRRDSHELAAIVDWELTTVGDPLLDIGQLVAMWPAPGEEPILPVEPQDGFPTAAELIDRYADGSERDLSAIDWYTVLACYRLGIILEGTNARAYAGKAPRDVGDSLHENTVRLFRRAEALIS